MDWTHYLQSIREDPKHSMLREFYTITTVEGETSRQKVLNSAPLLFDFALMVERVEEKQDQEGQEQERKQVERLGVLEGLRKYAKDHVLLQGKPGSGKSTGLKRLLLEEAETDNHIPVLVELKFYEESIVGLIREFLGRHGANLSNAAITEALANGEFLLLVDGVNELPSEAARRDLDTFQSRYQKSTAMIFTTRDLGLGGNLGIEKKLEMLPLSESQMREFVCAYLPDTGEAMLGTLGDRLREFGQTPLLLKMLCDLYAQAKDIPENLGLIFRAFTVQYENHPELKGKVPLGVSSKSFWGDLLQEIAFRMIQRDGDPKNFTTAIQKSEAEKIIWDFCKGANLSNSLGNARQWLEELLAYHLIELEGRDQITFCHQLIQEYYAAEKLLKSLSELDDESLIWDYLNNVKWTEIFKIAASLTESKKIIQKIIDCALRTDYCLGAQIIKKLDFPIQNKYITSIKKKSISEQFKLYLFYIINNHQVAYELAESFTIYSKNEQQHIIHLLGQSQIHKSQAVKLLFQLFYKVNWYIQEIILGALDELMCPESCEILINFLQNEQDSIKQQSSQILGQKKYDIFFDILVERYNKSDAVSFKKEILEIIGRIGTQKCLVFLVDLIINTENLESRRFVETILNRRSIRFLAIAQNLLSTEDKTFYNLSSFSEIVPSVIEQYEGYKKSRTSLEIFKSDDKYKVILSQKNNAEISDLLSKTRAASLEDLIIYICDVEYSEIIPSIFEKICNYPFDKIYEKLSIVIQAENYKHILLKTLMAVQSDEKQYRPFKLNSNITSNEIDCLIVTALVDEFNAIKNCLDGWTNGVDQNGFPFCQTKIRDKVITIARPVQMGETHTANLATRLISELKPKAIFMTGICAGNPDKVKLGDVIVASKIFKVDAGKQTPEGFSHDLTTYNLKPQWLHRLQDLAQDTNWYKTIQTPRPKTYAHQKGWLLHTLHDYRWKPDLCPPPQNHPDRELHCPDWQTVIEELVTDELITLSPLSLTPKAIDLIDENPHLQLATSFPHDAASPEVHLGAMATTSSVQEDPELFERIKKYAGQRNILGIEMEGAAIGAVAEITGIPMLIVKAVQDYGDTHKSDQFRAYAAEASACFLLTFLETIDLDSI